MEARGRDSVLKVIHNPLIEHWNKWIDKEGDKGAPPHATNATDR